MAQYELDFSLGDTAKFVSERISTNARKAGSKVKSAVQSGVDSAGEWANKNIKSSLELKEAPTFASSFTAPLAVTGYQAVKKKAAEKGIANLVATAKAFSEPSDFDDLVRQIFDGEKTYIQQLPKKPSLPKAPTPVPESMIKDTSNKIDGLTLAGGALLGSVGALATMKAAHAIKDHSKKRREEKQRVREYNSARLAALEEAGLSRPGDYKNLAFPAGSERYAYSGDYSEGDFAFEGIAKLGKSIFKGVSKLGSSIAGKLGKKAAESVTEKTAEKVTEKAAEATSKVAEETAKKAAETAANTAKSTAENISKAVNDSKATNNPFKAMSDMAKDSYSDLHTGEGKVRLGDKAKEFFGDKGSRAVARQSNYDTKYTQRSEGLGRSISESVKNSGDRHAQDSLKFEEMAKSATDQKSKDYFTEMANKSRDKAYTSYSRSNAISNMTKSVSNVISKNRAFVKGGAEAIKSHAATQRLKAETENLNARNQSQVNQQLRYTN